MKKATNLNLDQQFPKLVMHYVEFPFDNSTAIPAKITDLKISNIFYSTIVNCNFYNRIHY